MSNIANSTSKCFYLDSIHFSSENEAMYYTAVLVSIINFVFAFFALFGNAVIVVVIARTKSLHSTSNILLGSLALSDLLLAAVVQPIFIWYKVSELTGQYSCLVHVAFTTSAWICGGVSFLTVTAVSVERYFALFMALRYKTIISVRRTIIICVSIWIICVILVVARFLGLANQVFYIISCVVISICIVMISLIYVKVYRLVRRHQKHIKNTDMVLRNIEGRQAYERKMATTAGWIIGVFLICYTPTLIMNLLYVTLEFNLTMKAAYNWTTTLIFINACLNPFIYSMKNQDLRIAVWKLFEDIHCKSKSLKTTSKHGLGSSASTLSTLASNRSTLSSTMTSATGSSLCRTLDGTVSHASTLASTLSSACGSTLSSNTSFTLARDLERDPTFYSNMAIGLSTVPEQETDAKETEIEIKSRREFAFDKTVVVSFSPERLDTSQI